MDGDRSTVIVLKEGTGVQGIGPKDYFHVLLIDWQDKSIATRGIKMARTRSGGGRTERFITSDTWPWTVHRGGYHGRPDKKDHGLSLGHTGP